MKLFLLWTEEEEREQPKTEHTFLQVSSSKTSQCTVNPRSQQDVNVPSLPYIF